jgi:hypothetical protein
MKLLSVSKVLIDRSVLEASAPTVFPPTRSVIEILQAAFAAIKVRGEYVAAKIGKGSTKVDVESVLWDHFVEPADQPNVVLMRQLMLDPAIQQQAKLVLDWFNNLPASDFSQEGFLKSAKDVITRGNLTSRQIGFVVGLLPSFDRSGTGTPMGRSTGEWPPEWGEVKMLWKEKCVVKRSTYNNGSNQSSSSMPYFSVVVTMTDGHTFAFRSYGATEPKIGTTLIITGALEPFTPTAPFNAGPPGSVRSPRIMLMMNKRQRRDLISQLGSSEDDPTE